MPQIAQPCEWFLFDGAEVHHIAFALLAGRTLLAWLPPGDIGGHSIVRLPLTIITSWVLGTFAGWITSPLPAWLRWSVVGVALAARLLTLPAAMVPRHAPPVPRRDWISTIARVIAFVWLAVLAAVALDQLQLDNVTRGGSGCVSGALRPVVLGVSLLVVVHFAGRIARRSAGFALGIALLPLLSTSGLRALFADSSVLEAAVLFGTASSMTVAWLRRGDKRARAVAILALTALAALVQDQLGLALCGWAALVGFTPRPSMKSTASLALAGLLAAMLFGRANFAELPRDVSPSALQTLLEFAQPNQFLLLALLLLPALVLLVFRARRAKAAASITPPTREGAAVFASFGAALLCGPWSNADLLPLATLAAIVVSVNLLPAEKSGSNS